MYSHQRPNSQRPPVTRTEGGRLPPPPPQYSGNTAHAGTTRPRKHKQQTPNADHNGSIPHISLYHHQPRDNSPVSGQQSQLHGTGARNTVTAMSQHVHAGDTQGSPSALASSNMSVQSKIQKLNDEIQVLRERLQRGGIVNQHNLSARLSLVENLVQNEADDLKAFKQKVMRHLRDVSERISDVAASRPQDSSKSQTTFSYSHNPLVLSPGEQRAIDRSRNRTYMSGSNSSGAVYSPIQGPTPDRVQETTEADFATQLKKNRENLETLTREFEQLRVVMTEFPFSHSQLSDLQHQLYNRILSVLDSWGELLQQEVNRNIVRANQGIQEKISFLEHSLSQRVNALEKEYQTIRLIQNQYQFDMEDEEYVHQRSSRINDVDELCEKVQRLEDNQKYQQENMLFHISKLEHSMDNKLEAMYNYFMQSGRSGNEQDFPPQEEHGPHEEPYPQEESQEGDNEEDKEVVKQLRQSLSRGFISPQEDSAGNDTSTHLRQPRRTLDGPKGDDKKHRAASMNAGATAVNDSRANASQQAMDETDTRPSFNATHGSDEFAPHSMNANPDSNATSSPVVTEQARDVTHGASADTGTISDHSDVEWGSGSGSQQERNEMDSNIEGANETTGSSLDLNSQPFQSEHSSHTQQETTEPNEPSNRTIETAATTLPTDIEGEERTNEGVSEEESTAADAQSNDVTPPPNSSQQRLKQLKQRVGAKDEEERQKKANMTPEEVEEYERKKQQEKQHEEKYKHTLKKGLKQYASARVLKPGGRGSKRGAKSGTKSGRY